MKAATRTLVSLFIACLAPVPFAAAQTPQTPAAVGTSGSAAARPADAAATAPDYRLVAGDKLRIEVYKDDQVSQALQIRPDGKITLPLIGDVVAAGRTSIELRDAISTSLEEYMKSPTVTVIVTETAPQVIYVTGEVNKPGVYTMLNGRMTIMQALAMAGGLTDFAKRKDIVVQRKGAAGMQNLKFNYKDALDSIKEPLQLQPGDTVVVK